MAWMTCDACDKDNYADDNPMVEYREPRPSDKTDMCCTLAGHMKCFYKTLETIGASEHGGFATRQQWNEWIESKEARKAGFMFLG